MHLQGQKRDAWHRCLGEPEAPRTHKPGTLPAIDDASRRARELKQRGRLIKPAEAMAVACKDGHATETLYSIARQAAQQFDGDVDAVLRRLEHDWPDYA
jgi:hypothetical protein